MLLLMSLFCLISIISSYLYYLYSKTTLSILQLYGYSVLKFVKSGVFINRKKKLAPFAIVLLFIIIVLEMFVFFDILKNGVFFALIFMVNAYVFLVWFVQKNNETKTPLVITNRVKRLIFTQSILAFVMFFVFLHLCIINSVVGFGVLLFVFVFADIITILSTHINKLPESVVYVHYINKAKNKLKKYKDLKIIGITGSYGKTSVKFFLTQILKEEFFAVCTPKSFNTEMGITKSVLQDLKPHHEIFVVEMGADKLNDIKKICNFIKPDISILTNIGVQHLKTFKTKENLIKTKLQIMSMKHKNIVGYFGVDSEPVYNEFLKNESDKYSVSLNSKNAYCYAGEIKTTSYGMEFFVYINKKRFKLQTMLLGEHNALNILMAVCVAFNLGVGIDKIKKAVSELKYVKHRLEPVRLSSGALLLDNSFNSNPIGARYSIKVLEKLEFNKKIVITPGLVELGELQYEKNYNFARQISQTANFVCIVNYVNKNALYKGLIENGFSEKNIMFFTSFKLAFEFIKPQLNSETVVLIENDLPDNYI